MNKNIKEIEKFLKRSLKKKVKITTSLILLFMMSNSIISKADYITSDKGKIGTPGKSNKSKGSIALNPKTENDSAVQHQQVGDFSVAIGIGSQAPESNSISIGSRYLSNKGILSLTTAEGEDSIAIGSGAYVRKSDNGGKGIMDGDKGRVTESSIAIGTKAITALYRSIAIGNTAEAIPLKMFYPDYRKNDNDYIQNGAGGEAVAIGSGTKAVDQATSIGNGTYAIGRSSIALGSDDNENFRESISRADYNHYFKKIYGIIDKNGDSYGFKNDGYMYTNKVIYSPTLAAGSGGVSIGTRALSYGIGATSIGAFSYALGDYSAAMGAKTRAEGKGAIAIGNGTRVFSDKAVAVGNENEVSKKGGLAYGYKAISSGNNTIAIGTDVYGNVNIETNGANGVHKKYATNDVDIIKNIHSEFEDKNITNTLNNLEKLYTNNDSYTAKEEEKQLEYSGKKETTGQKVKKQNGNNALVIGTKAVAKGDNSITLGHAAFSMKDNSVAIGSYAYVNGKNSIGFGIGTKVLSDNALIFGLGSVATSNAKNSLILGNAAFTNAENTLALGNKSSAYLKNSMALGNESTTDYKEVWLKQPGYAPKGAISMPSSSNIGIVSFGSIGQERRLTNVAAGYRDTDVVNVSQLKSLEEKLSTVNPDEKESSMMNYVAVDKEANGSEGKKIKEIAMKELYYKQYIQLKSKQLEIKVRKERNKESFDDTFEKDLDKKIKSLESKNIKAINNSKLKTFDIEKEIKNDSKFANNILKEISEAKDTDLSVEKVNSVLEDSEKELVKKSNFYNSGAKGKDAVSIGVYASATGNEAIGIGKDTDANGANSVVIGTKNAKSNKTDNGDTDKSVDKITAKTDGVAIGHGVESEAYSVGIGSNVYAGNTAVAIGDRSKANGKFAITIGERSSANSESAIAVGTRSKVIAKYGIALGEDSKATKENAIAIGKGARAEHNDSIAMGNGSVANESTKDGYLTNQKHTGGEVVSFGSASKLRRIVNIADGINDTDVVTIAQLKKVKEDVDKVSPDKILGEIEGRDGIYTRKDKDKLLIGINNDKLNKNIENKFNAFKTDINNNIDKKINGKYIEFSGDDINKKVKVNLDKGLQIKGDTNITVAKSNDASLQVSLKKDLNVDSLTLNNKKINVEGDNLKFAGKTIATNDKIDSLVLKYTSNGKGNNTTKLKDGLNFKNGKNTIAEVENNGIVKYNLAENLTDITSIKGKKDKNNQEIKFDTDNGIQITDNNKTIALHDGKITGLDTTDKTIEAGKAVSGAILNEALKGYIKDDGSIIKKAGIDDLGFVISDNNNTNGQKIFVKSGNNKVNKINLVSDILDIDTKTSGTINFKLNKKGKTDLANELLSKVPNIKAEDGSAITVKNGKNEKIIGLNEDKIKEIVNKTDISNYTKNDFSNLTDGAKTEITNLVDVVGDSENVDVTSSVDSSTKKKTFTVKLNDTLKQKMDKIGTGEIKENNDLTVNGGVVYKAINDAKNDILSKKLTFKGDDSSPVTIGLSEELNIKGGANSGVDNNIYVVKGKDNTLNIKLAKDINGISSISMADGIKVDSTGINMNSKRITGLATPVNTTDAVNKNYVDEHVANVVKTLADDIKKGKGINIEATSPTIYVYKEEGKDPVKVKKVGDEVYKETDLDDSTGTITPKDGATALSDEELKKVYIAAINPSDKLVTTKTKLSNIDDGEISENSTDAVNGSQLAKILGIDGRDKKIDENGNIVVKKDGKEGKLNVLDKIVELDGITNKEITFKANNEKTSKKVKLGSEISIKAKDNTEEYDSNKYSGKNLYATVSDDGINIEMKESPEFKGVTVGDEGITIKKGNQKTTILNIDNTTGDLVINKGGDKNEKLITDKNIGSQSISYYNNKKEGDTAKKVLLNKGFDFVDGTNIKASVTGGDVNEAKVQFNLSDELKGISSIKGNSPNEATILEFNDDGLKLNNKKISGIMSGDISKDSKDAVTGGQINDILNKIGIKPNENDTDMPKIKNEKGEDVTGDNILSSNIKNIINTINKGYKFGADTGNETTNQLGSKISIIKAKDKITDNDSAEYLGNNILTKISKNENGDSEIELGFKDKPEFKEITLGDTKKVTLVVDKNGDLNVNSNNGGTVINKKLITEDNIGNQTIAYKVNKDEQSENVNLNTGFTFKDDTDGNNIKVTKDKGGVINFNLSNTLSGINSISNGDKKIEITNEGVKIGNVTIDGSKINISNPSSTHEDGDVITYKELTDKINGLKVNDATKEELDKKVNKDASNLEDADVNKWKEKLGVSNLDLKVEGTKGSYTTTLGEGIQFDGNEDIEVNADAGSKKLKLTINDKLKNKINAIDLEKGKKLSEVYLKQNAENLSDDGITNLKNKLRKDDIKQNPTGFITGQMLTTELSNSYLHFVGDSNEKEDGAKINLNSKIDIKGKAVRKEGEKDLKNILVSTKENEINLELSKDLYGMNSIEFENNNGNKSTIAINDKGDIVINTKNGDVINTSKLMTSKNSMEQDLNYRVNGGARIRKPDEKLTLKQGLNFVNDENENIKITDEGNIGDIKFNLNKNLKAIESVGKSEKSKISFDDTAGSEKVNISTSDKTLTIEKDGNGIKVSGIEEKKVDNNYGNGSGEVATRKEVKQVYDKINEFTDAKQKLEDGLAGNIVYTDDNGTTIVKEKVNGVFKYKIKDSDKEVPDGKVKISLKDAKGNTTGDGITLTNLKNNLDDNGLDKLKDLTGLNEHNAATLGDLQKVANNVNKFTGNDRSKLIDSKIGEVIAIRGEFSKNDNIANFGSASGNIKVDVSEDKKALDIKLSKDLKNLDSIKVGDKISLDKEKGLQVGEVKIGLDGEISGIKGLDNPFGYVDDNGKEIIKTKNGFVDGDGKNIEPKNISVVVKDSNLRLKVKDGEIAKGSKDVVNGGQLYDVREMASKADEKSDLALGGVANAVAMANLLQVNSYSDYRHNISAAYGYYGRQHALSVGFSGVSENRRINYRISGSVNTQGNLAFGGGIGVMLGNKEERYTDKLEKLNVAKLHDRIDELEKDKISDRKEIENLKRENQEIKEMLKKILKK